MHCPEFTREGNMITIDPQDLLRMFGNAQLSDPRPSRRGTWPRSYVRGSGLFSSFSVTPLLMNESKDASAPGHWKNLKSSVHNAVACAKNKVKTPKYDPLMEEDSSGTHETDESDDDATENDYSKDTKPLKTDQKSIACSVCQREFANSCNLARHTKSVHSLIKHDCRDCGRSFARSDGLRVHMKICKKIP
jgi:uncharacterized Zn-finger protein